MDSRIVFGVLLGATIGFAVGHFSQRAGGTCPLVCNPYGGAIFGAVMGALLAGALSRGMPSYTPSPHLVSIDSAGAFHEKVVQVEGPALVEFYTTNCPHCRRMEPVIHSLADRFAGRALIAKVNAAQLRELTRRYGIRGVPTTILFRDGQEVERMEGYQPEESMASLIQKHLPVAPQPAEEESSGDQ